MNSDGEKGRSGPGTWLGVVSRLLVTLLFIVLLLFLGSCGLPGQHGTATPTSVAATAYLLVEVAPRGAQVYVDGMRSGSTPATLTLRPGQHTIRVEQDGFEPLVEAVNLAADDEATISGELVPLASPVPTVTLIVPSESGSANPCPIWRSRTPRSLWRQAAPVNMPPLPLVLGSGSRIWAVQTLIPSQWK